MNKLIITFCLIGMTVSANAAVDLTNWNWQRSIDIRNSSGFVRLVLTPEVFNESQAMLDDLRIMDGNNNLVPHVIHWGRVKGTQHLEWQTARLLNETFVPGKYATVTADFGAMAEKNHIVVSLSGQNYRRRALVEGSHDSRVWEVVAEEVWLFDVSLPDQNFKVDTIQFRTNNFRYLRLTVYNMTDDPRRITIETVKCAFQRTEMEKEMTPVAVKQMVVSHDEKRSQTMIELDLGFRNLPVASLQFEITTPYFYRGYELLGRNDSKEKVPRKTETRWDTREQDVPWRSIDRGVLYRIQHQQKMRERLNVEDLNASYRFLQIRIHDGDNPPLKVERISLFRRDTSLVFQAQAGQVYTLIGGNPKVGEANYDLAKSIQGIDELMLPSVGLGPSVAIPHKGQIPPWTERHSTLLWIILILAVAGMLILIVRSFKKLPSARERS
ncbi:MAG: DUF3999 family protein [Thermodesulfobacteriota bacterium]|jgi:hypothetical protein